MNSQDNCIVLGELRFCLQQQQFFKGTAEVRAEPKVCELLYYLYLHRERYVPLSELHDELWRGRVVSDTAVRRTISKLRTLLGEDGSQQGFIRSLSKRGYKLVIAKGDSNGSSAAAGDLADDPGAIDDFMSVNAVVSGDVIGEQTLVQASSEPSAAAASPLINEVGAAGQNAIDELDDKPLSTMQAEVVPEQASGYAVAVGKRRIVARWWWLVPVILLCVGLMWFTAKVNLFSPLLQQKADSTAPLAAFKLDVPVFRTLALSSDRRYLVYAGSLAGQDGHELYLKDLSNGLVRQLTDQNLEQVYISAAFAAKDNLLLFISADGEQFTFSQLDLTTQQAQPEILLQQPFMLSSLFVAQQQNLVLLGVSSTIHDGAIYRYDLTNRALTAQSFPADPSTYDAEPRLDPNGRLLAYTRNKTNSPSQLVIQDFASGTLRQQLLLPKGYIYDLQWRDSERLLVVYRDKIIEMDITNGQQQEVKRAIGAQQYFHQLLQWQPGEFLLLEMLQQTQFYQWLNGVNQPVLNLPADTVIAIQAPTGGEYYLVRRGAEQGGYNLSHYNAQQGTEQLLLQLNEPIKDLLLSPDNRYLHFLVGGRLALYDLADAKLDNLTSNQQVAVLGEFSHDQQALIYGEQLAGSWRLMQYQLASGERQLWRSGYIQARRLQTGYLLQDANGRLTALDSTDALTPALAELETDPYARLQLYYPMLYHIVIRKGRATVQRYNLQNGQSAVILPYSSFNFSFDTKGQQMLNQHISSQSQLSTLRFTD